MSGEQQTPRQLAHARSERLPKPGAPVDTEQHGAAGTLLSLRWLPPDVDFSTACAAAGGDLTPLRLQPRRGHPPGGRKYMYDAAHAGIWEPSGADTRQVGSVLGPDATCS